MAQTAQVYRKSSLLRYRHFSHPSILQHFLFCWTNYDVVVAQLLIERLHALCFLVIAKKVRSRPRVSNFYLLRFTIYIHSLYVYRYQIADWKKTLPYCLVEALNRQIRLNNYPGDKKKTVTPPQHQFKFIYAWTSTYSFWSKVSTIEWSTFFCSPSQGSLVWPWHTKWKNRFN